MTSGPAVRLVYPHQLFSQHLEAAKGTHFLLIEDDLFFRQYNFHTQKLVLHRASMRRFADRLREAGFEVQVIETSSRKKSDTSLTEAIEHHRPAQVQVYDVVDDWLGQRVIAALAKGGYDLSVDDVLESPNFLTSRPELKGWFAENSARMQTFYQWQRIRLDVLVDGESPVGGRWSFDEENRKKLPKKHPVPSVTWPEPGEHVADAITWVGTAFPDAPGRADSFAWPTSHEEAEAGLEQFLAERFATFGPYEDAVSSEHAFLFHSVITPALNIGLLDPRHVLERALEEAQKQDVELASLEGFVRQLIGWREYMRATYRLYGRRMRTSNHLRHTRDLAPGWWSAEVGLAPVDLVIERVRERGWAHHIERLMILGNMMSLLRIDPEEVYRWFMEMFVDAYDWVMVPNVYAMSQFAAGEAITTKPYVSGSNYLKKMSDLPNGDWREAWDGLYWSFVDDHREVFENNYRSKMMTRMWDGFDDQTRQRHRDAAAPWLR